MKIANDIRKLYDTLKPAKWGPDGTITGNRGGRTIMIKRLKWYGNTYYKYRVASFGWSPAINIKQLQTRFDAMPRTPEPTKPTPEPTKPTPEPTPTTDDTIKY